MFVIIAKEEDKTNSFQMKLILLLVYSIYAGGGGESEEPRAVLWALIVLYIHPKERRSARQCIRTDL